MSGDTLRRAASQGQSEYLKKLLAAGSNPCSVDEIGATALHHAVWNGHEEAVKVLLANDRGTNDSGARSWALQQQTDAGWSALHGERVKCRLLSSPLLPLSFIPPTGTSHPVSNIIPAR